METPEHIGSNDEHTEGSGAIDAFLEKLRQHAEDKAQINKVLDWVHQLEKSDPEKAERLKGRLSPLAQESLRTHHDNEFFDQAIQSFSDIVDEELSNYEKKDAA